MSRFTSAQRQTILAEARANIAKRETASSRRSEGLVYKTNHDAAVGSARAPSERRSAVASSELSWWEWTTRHVDACLTAAAEEWGGVLGQELDAIQHELQLLRRELATVRDEVAVERGLRDLRTKIETASAQVPEVPALVAGLEKEQERLRREVETVKSKVTRVRTNQILADGRLAEWRKEIGR